MPRQLTPRSTLDNLKREAKRWLKELRANVREARARLERAFPKAPPEPTLRDVQHALALEHGLSGWVELKNQLARGARATDSGRAELVARFLENACPDHHVRGRPAHAMARHTAMRILKRHPEIARDSLYTAVVCGDLAEVERILAERSQAASEKSSETSPDRAGPGGAGDLFKTIGPKGWEPLLYLCFTRLPLAAANDNAVAIARALLDRGADPNAYFMAGDSRYTPLVGVIGEGEEDRPPHQKREELTRLLLDRGAEPYDIQVLYNVHSHGDILWLLEMSYAHSIRLGRRADWDDPEWSMLDMGGYGPGAYYLLAIAVRKNDIPLAKWILTHGASPNATKSSSPKFKPKRTLYEEAVRNGDTEMADLLLHHGATPSVVTLEPEELFSAACFRLDGEKARALLAEHPELLRSPVAMFASAKRDRADVVAFLLNIGVPVDVEDAQRQRALHLAAYNDSTHVAKLLIERGAEIDPVELNWYNTPLDCAVHSQHPRMIELLSPFSRDIWNLTFTGNVDRVREVLGAQPDLARVVGTNGGTPLMWLPDDDAQAMEIARLLLAHGADPAIRNKEGQTAADRARKRALDDVADVLSSGVPTSAPPPGER